MKIKHFFYIAFFWSNIVFSSNQFVEFFSAANSLKADFIQATYDSNLIMTSRSSGSLAFQRPKQFLWHVTQPNEQILLLNDDKLWQIDTELEQVILQKQKDLSKTPLYWLIKKPSSIANVPQFSHTADGIDWYLATSSNGKTIKFAFVNKQLHAVTLNNDLGGLTSIIFKNILINPKLDPNVFQPNIDSNFDIID